MSGKHYAGPGAVEIEAGRAFLPYTKVCVVCGEVDGEQLVYYAILQNGTATATTDESTYEALAGRALEVTNPWGTQQMAVDILNRIKGYEYHPYSARGAFISDDAELGDGVTVGGVYGTLASQNITFDSLMASDIEASGADETENEFGIYTDGAAKELRRRVNAMSTTFTVEMGKIESEITSDSGAVASRITQRLNDITLSVSSKNGSSTFTLKDGETTLDTETLNMTVSAVNISGKLTASQINATELHVSAANVDGKLTASQINVTGAITWDDLASDSKKQVTDAQTAARTAQTAADAAQLTANDAAETANNAKNTVSGWRYGGTTYIDGTQIMAGTVSASELKGGTITVLDSSGRAAGYFYPTGAASYAGQKLVLSTGALELDATYGTVYISAADRVTLSGSSGNSCIGNFYPNQSGQYSCGISYWRWTDVYADNGTIVTSDRNRKTDIEYGLERFSELFDGLSPVSYRFVDGKRRHMGMISQEVERLIAECGLTTMDVAAFIKSEDPDEEGRYNYALRYEEFIPLLIYEVQTLKKRVKESEQWTS